MRTDARIRNLALTLAAALLVGGCSLHNPHPVGSFERGAYYAERGNNVEAVAALESYVRHNPADSLAAEAQYLKAMTYMKMEEFPLAAVEFQILRKDYPTSDRVQDAFFQEGMAYFRQVGRIERDMTGAYDARSHFARFLEVYPRSPRTEEVQGVLREISDLLVRKRLEQANVYRQLGKRDAVAATLDDVLAKEPGSRLMDQVLWERARAAAALGDHETAEEMYERLVAEFPDSAYGRRAAGALPAARKAAVAAETEG